MLTRRTPLPWRKGFTLHRRVLTEDSLGDPVAAYDMENPDFTARDGSEEGICWQPGYVWGSLGRLGSQGAGQEEYGQRDNSVISGVLWSGLELAAFDRLVVEDTVYEIRAVQQWPDFRRVLAQRVV